MFACLTLFRHRVGNLTEVFCQRGAQTVRGSPRKQGSHDAAVVLMFVGIAEADDRAIDTEPFVQRRRFR